VKVLHVPYSYPPDPPGGTELYVAALCAGLANYGVRSVVAAPAASDEVYAHDGVPVRRFAMAPDPPIEALYGAGDPVAARGFARVLDAEQPDRIHLHAFTAACSVRLVREARRRGIPTVLTYHTPTVSCPRGTLMLWGDEPCDGRLDESRCVACTAAAHGASRPLASLIGHVPVSVGAGLGRLGLSGGVLTAARLSELVGLRHAAVRELLAGVNCIVALTDWVRRVLLVNDVAEERIVSCAHGVRVAPDATEARPAADRRGAGDTVRLAHLGRLHPVKGTELLLRAFTAVEADGLRLDVFGVVQDAGGEALAERLQRLAAGDPRVRMRPALAPHDVIPTLRGYDAVVVPSQWMETGPLVVLEAFAAGVPVLGSRLGGIADKVRHERDGLLVNPPASVEAWRGMLRRIADPTQLRELRAGVRPPRSDEDVAAEMAGLYASLAPRGVPDGRSPAAKAGAGR
jgi:glycosyltransferase involved in cell wall biosynthesis